MSTSAIGRRRHCSNEIMKHWKHPKKKRDQSRFKYIRAAVSETRVPHSIQWSSYSRNFNVHNPRSLPQGSGRCVHKAGFSCRKSIETEKCRKIETSISACRYPQVSNSKLQIWLQEFKSSGPWGPCSISDPFLVVKLQMNLQVSVRSAWVVTMKTLQVPCSHTNGFGTTWLSRKLLSTLKFCGFQGFQPIDFLHNARKMSTEPRPQRSWCACNKRLKQPLHLDILIFVQTDATHGPKIFYFLYICLTTNDCKHL